MHRWPHRNPEDPDPGRATKPAPRVGAPGSVEPVLQLQAAVGNAAVTSWLRAGAGPPAPNVQRLWDTEDEEDVPSDEGPAEDNDGGARRTKIAQGSAGRGDDGPVRRGRDRGRFDARPGHRARHPGPARDSGATTRRLRGPRDRRTAQALRIQRDNTPEEPGATREGKPGDIIKAFKPYLEPALKWLEQNVLDALKKIKAGEAVITVIVAAPIIIGPLTQPGPRRLALDQLDGTDVTFGVIPNLKIKPQITDGELRGGTVTYDLAPALRKWGIPF